MAQAIEVQTKMNTSAAIRLNMAGPLLVVAVKLLGSLDTAGQLGEDPRYFIV
jgi:hypothetical protein